MSSITRINRKGHAFPARVVRPIKIIAKLSRPQADNVILRNRLFARLEQAALSPVIWITAPGGAGKTILASSYLAHHQLSHLWYRLDGSDADPATFFYYLRMADEKMTPCRRRKLPLLTPEFLPGITNFSRTFFAEFFAGFKTPAFIVLDDYHQISTENPIHEILLAALDRIPPGINFLILSRHEPHPIFTRLRACRQLAVLTWQDLRLTPAECLEIAAIEKAPSNLDVEKFCKKIDGWAVGLRLFLEAAGFGMEEPENLAGSSQQMIFDYFSHEIFLRMPDQLKQFLVKTSLLPQMTEKMARELTGIPQTGHILQSLVKNNQFTERSVHGNHYRYHPLFQTFLQNQAEYLLTVEELTDLKSQAAAVLLAADMVESAATLYIRAADWSGLGQLIVQQAPVLTQQGRNQILASWLGALPQNILDGSPWLQFWRGSSRMFFDQAESRSWLSLAYGAFKKQGDAVGSYMAWAGIIECYIHEWDQISPLDHWIAEMAELRQRFPDFPSPEVKMRVIGSMFAALIYRQPDHAELDHWLQQAEALALSAADLPQRLLIGCNLFLYYLWTGNLPKQGFILAALRRIPLQEDQLAHAPYLIMLDCLELFSSIFIGASEEEILKNSAKVERMATESGFHLFDHKMPFVKIYYYMLAGEYSPLADLLDQLAVSLERRSLEKNHMYLLQAWYAWTVQGDSGKALEYLKFSLRMSEETGFWNFIAYNQSGLAHLYTVLGDYRQASFHLAQLHKSSEKYRSALLAYHYLVFNANLAFAREEEEHGLAFLRQALALARTKGFLATMSWWQPTMMANLCCKALEAGIETEYARHLIRKCRLRPASPPVEIEQWPWPLKIYTLGRFEIVVNDEPLRFTSRAQQKPLLLLKALIALGGRRIYEGHLAELLWPDVDGDLQHQNFRTTLHRLRRLLSLPEAILFHEGQLALDSHHCWVDLWAFERLATQAAKTWGKEPEKAEAVSRRAIELYNGHFMKLEENTAWMLPLRERLHTRFLGQIEELGGFYLKKREWKQAIDLYWQGLAVDPLVESFYQAIITCHLATDNRAEAARVYASCRETFLKLRGTEPSLPNSLQIPGPIFY
jgi:LuxR family transcriptional regulator, maltose regulon positive regulatory protein